MTTMYNPSHPGESLRDALAAEGWTVTEAASKLGCTRQTLSRLLNGRTGISPALALERLGWTNASFWVRRQAQYDLAQERIRQEHGRRGAVEDRRITPMSRFHLDASQP